MKTHEDGWRHFTDQLHRICDDVCFSTPKDALTVDAGLRLRTEGKTLYCVGNGASASMCSHFAADIMKNARIRTAVFTDLALLTAVGNDLSYADVYSYPLGLNAKEGDCLLAISSSGTSSNILKALDVALQHGVYTITLTAMSPGNPARKRGDLNVYFPAQTYGHAETVHAAILHHWTDVLIKQTVD